MLKSLNLHIIAYIYTSKKEKYESSIQPELTLKKNVCFIEFINGFSFEQAIADLNGFERIWLVYHFHKNENWKTKVQVPRLNKKIGVFATRSPHRPSPIGISVCKVIKIDGRRIYIENNDILDGTPILDVKPYIPQHDSFPDSKIGWNNEIQEMQFEFEESWELSQKLHSLDFDFIEAYIENIKETLAFRNWQNKNTRIKQIDEKHFQIAYKSWRFNFTKENIKVIFTDILSGYDKRDIETKSSEDIHHYEYHKRYYELFAS